MISRCQNVACHRRGERPFIEAGRNGLQRDSDREKGEGERLLRVTITSRATRHCLGLSTLLVGGFSRFPGEEGGGENRECERAGTENRWRKGDRGDSDINPKLRSFQ